MYAALMTLTIKPRLAPQAADSLLPQVKAAQGFVADYWVDPIDGHGFGFLVFSSEEEARAATVASLWSAPGVLLKQIDIRRIAARA